MASPTVKTFKYTTAAQQPILSVIETPLKYRSFVHNNSNTNSYVHLQELPTETSTNHDNVHSPQLDDSEINVFDAQKYFSESNDDSKEINLSPSNLNHIAAEVPIDSVSRLSSVSSVDGYARNNFRVRSFHATPTASSEASWNSQTGLLTNPPGSIPVSLRNPAADKKRSGSSSTGRKWFFCRKCPCSGKKSVEVEEGILSENKEMDMKSQSNSTVKVHVNSHKKSYYSQRTTDHDQKVETLSIEYQRSPPDTHRKVGSNPVKLQSDNHFVMPSSTVVQHRVVSGIVGGFSFPVLKNDSHAVVAATPNSISNSQPKTSVIISPVLVEEAPRESLEVFQPPESSNLKKSIEDDVGSDASSDLFEIESFTTQTIPNYPNYRRRDSLDDAQTLNARRLAASNGSALEGRRSSLDEPMTPRTECYAPSEASIDWSVTTAEGFEKASVSIAASEIDEFTTFRGIRSSIMGKNTEEAAAAALNSNSHGKKKLGNGLLSCRHEKAVNVGPHPLRCMQLEGPPLQLISTSSHVSTANRLPKPNVPPTSSRSHAARLSLAFAA